ncbi:MAG: TlpA disulfide reductase family protein [Burkholderiales bacterium]
MTQPTKPGPGMDLPAPGARRSDTGRHDAEGPVPARPDAARRRLVVAAGAWAVAPGAARALERGQPVDWPTLKMIDGSTLAPEAWVDRAAVIVFWATWCPFCTRHNPHLDTLSRAVAGRPMRVVGASLDRDPDLVRRHVREHGLGFPMTMDAQALRTRFGLTRRVTPTTVVVDRRGRFVQAIPGEMFEEDVMELARWAGDATASVDGGAR